VNICAQWPFSFPLFLHHNLWISFLGNSKNMILMDVIEQRVINRADYSADATPKEFLVERELAQAMLPGKHLVKVEIEKEEFEARMKERKEEGDFRVATALPLAL
jgi:hypothetical protein